MKSKVVKLANYSDLIKSYQFDFILDEKVLDEALYSIVIKNRILEKVLHVSKGDLVTVNLESELKKFNKNSLKIVVGSNFFSEELENNLVDMSLNEVKNVKIDNFDVKITVLEILRTSLPKLTDELIKKENIAGVETVADYKKMIYEDNKENYLEQEIFKLSNNIFKKLSAESEFNIIEEEVLDLYNTAIDRFRNIAKEEGLVFEEMTKEELLPRLAASSVEEVKIREKEYCLFLVKSAAICSEILKKDISQIETTRDNIFLLHREFFSFIRKELAL
ncbi:MAG TPA: hypothetical protein VIK84_06515 [Haloplasmataceae bacterium]